MREPRREEDLAREAVAVFRQWVECGALASPTIMLERACTPCTASMTSQAHRGQTQPPTAQATGLQKAGGGLCGLVLICALHS